MRTFDQENPKKSYFYLFKPFQAVPSIIMIVFNPPPNLSDTATLFLPESNF